MMKNYYYFLLCLIVCSFFSSCDEDEKETIPPVVTITSPNASGKLLKTVTIAASATDDSGIASVKILVDDTLLEEFAEGEVSHEWNTETASDGAHTITVVATDRVGNEGTATLEVEVFNDKKAPVVTITTPATQPFVKSTVNISGSVTDDSSLESIKIYAGDVLLTTVTNSNTFSFDWDTKTIADGNHTIKVTAVDNRGNEASATSQVKVYNYFVTLNVVNPKVPSHVAIWYLISKYDGTLIQAKPYVAGETKIRFETPDNFNPDEHYVFTSFHHIGKFEAYAIQDYFFAEAGFKPGEMNVTPSHTYGSSTTNDFMGYHIMKIADVPAYQYLFLKGVNMYSPTQQGAALSIDMGMYASDNNNLNPTVALLRNADEAPRFKGFTGLQVGETTQTDFDDFTPMVGNKIPAPADATYTYDGVYGVSGSNYNETNVVWSYSGFMSATKSHYLYNPSGAFSEYIYSAQEGAPTSNDYYMYIGAQAPSSFKRSTATVSSFTKQNRTLNLQTTGVYDLVILSGSLNEGVGEDFKVNYWSLQLPDGANHSITLPQLPAVLASYNFPDLNTIAFSNASFYDYNGFSSHEAVKNYISSNPGGSLFSVAKEYVSKSIQLPSPGGRLKEDAFIQTHKITLQTGKQMGLVPVYYKEK